MKRLSREVDGLGKPLDSETLYYVHEGSTLSDSVLFWRPEWAGYTFDLNSAGVYNGDQCRRMRITDIPWPIEYIQDRIAWHVLRDNLDFSKIE